MRLPGKIRNYLRSTDWIERLFRELKDYFKKHERYLSRRLRYSGVMQGGVWGNESENDKREVTQKVDITYSLY